MKSTTSAMTTHLAGDVTRLAANLEIVRRDGEILYFTGHDRDLAIGGITYKAKPGLFRQAVVNDATMAVDNLDFVAIIDDDDITESDLAGGKYDDAEVRLFLVDWENPADGAVKLRRATLGEVTPRVTLIWTGELRGMTQHLSRRVGELVQPLCLTTVGTPRCRIPIKPDVVARNTAYAVGDYVRATDLLAAPPAPALLVTADVDLNDDSDNAATGTAGSQAVRTTSTTKVGAGAILFSPSGSDDPSEAYVSYPDAAAYTLAGDDFSFECWVRFSDLTATDQVIASHWETAGNARGWVLKRSGTTLAFAYSTDGSGSTSVGRSVSWAIDTWYHVAVTRSGADLRLFRDGVQQGATHNIGANTIFNPATALRLGKMRAAGAGDEPLYGRLDHVRLIVGDPVYTETFTPPAEDFPQGVLASTLLVKADADLDDSSANGATGTAGSKAALTTALAKVGAGSIEFTPSSPTDPGDYYVSYPDIGAYALGTADFTIECWIRFKSLTENFQVFCAQYNTTGNQKAWYIGRLGGSLRFFYSTTGANNNNVDRTVTWAADTWYHIAVTRRGADLKIFRDGVQQGATHNIGANTIHNSTDPIYLGKYRVPSSNDPKFFGYLDHFRLIAGHAAYISAFTPPTADFPDAGSILAAALTADFGDVIYRCVTAGTTAAVQQPAYDSGIGNDTTDGSAVFRAEAAWTRAAEVNGVTDRAVFNIAVTEPRAVTGWFDHGTVLFETGANAGVAREVKYFTADTEGGEVEVFDAFPFAIETGDALSIHAGCDLTLATCRDKFANAVNRQAFDFVPGEKSLRRYPDAF